MNEMNMKSRNPLLVFLWSTGLFILVQILLGIGLTILALRTGEDPSEIARGGFTRPMILFWAGLFALLIVTPFLFLVVRFLWRRSADWMRTAFQLKNFGFGLLAGFLIATVTILLLAIFGAVQVEAYPSRFSLLQLGAAVSGQFFMMIFVGISEEYIFRGMIAREWAAKWGWIVSALASGVLFGLIHNFNVGFSDWLTVIWIGFSGMLFTILLVTMYVRSKSLWMPIGFHTSWNFALAGIYGATVSGIPSELGVFNMDLVGPLWISGGEFGIELSVVTIVVLIIATFLVLKMPWRGDLSYLDARLSNPPDMEKEI